MEKQSIPDKSKSNPKPKLNFEERFMGYVSNNYSIDELKRFRDRVNQKIITWEQEKKDIEQAIEFLSKQPMHQKLLEWYDGVLVRREAERYTALKNSKHSKNNNS